MGGLTSLSKGEIDFSGIVRKTPPPQDDAGGRPFLREHGWAALLTVSPNRPIALCDCLQTSTQAVIGASLDTDAEVKGCLWAVPAVRAAL
jgi:hypothetical protein